VSLSDRVRSIFLCVVLEFGAITGVPMPPEKIRALLDAMNQPSVAHVLPEEDEGGGPPP